MILAALWLTESPDPAVGFSLAGPTAVSPGKYAALRTWHLTEDGVGAPATTVELRDAYGTHLSTTTLERSRVAGSEGEARVPDDAIGTVSFTARADIEGASAAVTYTVSVDRDDALEDVPPGRETSPFHVYELGPLIVLRPKSAPPELDPRIEGGACVPELPCWLSIWVGNRRSHLRLRPLTGVRVESLDHRGAGFVRVPLLVVGNEARLEVQALDHFGEVAASREVRLPIVPGGLSLRASAEGGRIRVDWDQVGGQEPILVDVYDGPNWRYAFSVAPEDPYLPVELPEGVWRIQARRDFFSRSTAGVAHVVVSPGSPKERMQMAAKAVLARAHRDGLDPLAMAIVEGRVPVEHASAAVLALFGPSNFGVVSLTSTVSLLEPGSNGEREVARWIAAALILTIGLLVSLLLLRMDLRARARARELLEGLDESQAVSSLGAPLERWLWLFVGCVFVAIAALALSKGWF